MTDDAEEDVIWLAGTFDSKGAISVTQSRNIVGNVSLNLSTESMKEMTVGVIEKLGIHCNPAVTVGKQLKLNFTSTRGTQLLLAIIPHMKDEAKLEKARLYTEIFPLESKGKHMKISRLDGYGLWLNLLVKHEKERRVHGQP